MKRRESVWSTKVIVIIHMHLPDQTVKPARWPGLVKWEGGGFVRLGETPFIASLFPDHGPDCPAAQQSRADRPQWGSWQAGQSVKVSLLLCHVVTALGVGNKNKKQWVQTEIAPDQTTSADFSLSLLGSLCSKWQKGIFDDGSMTVKHDSWSEAQARFI